MAKSSHKSHTTTDHEIIQKWVDERGGRPAVVAATVNGGGGGVLRIDFGEPNDELEEIAWDDFFRIFDERKLTFLYQEETATGEQSFFFKFIEHGSEEERDVEEGDGDEGDAGGGIESETDDGIES